MIEGKTKSGFKFRIDDNALDDMELLDALMDMDEDKDGKGIYASRTALKALLGEEQVKSLYEFIRDKETGKVSAKKVYETFGEIMDSAKGNTAIKN